MTKRAKKDTAMAAANDQDGAKAAEKFNPAIPLDEAKIGTTVKKVLDKIEKKKKRMPNVVVTDERRVVGVKHEFGAAELRNLGETLARIQTDLVQVEEEKKSVVSSFADRIKAKKYDLNRFSRQMIDGFEIKDHNCILILDFKKKEKRYRDVDTKKIVKIEAFGPGDDQRRFL